MRRGRVIWVNEIVARAPEYPYEAIPTRTVERVLALHASGCPIERIAEEIGIAEHKVEQALTQ